MTAPAASLVLTDSLKPPSPREFEEFERSRGVRLPEDYKSFLRVQNGGSPVSGSPDAFAIPSDWEEYGTLVTFYAFALGAREACTLPHAWDENDGWFPRELWPIGDDASGAYVGIVLGGSLEGKVVYLESDLLTLPEASIEELASQEGFVPLADSFTDFLALLVPYPD